MLGGACMNWPGAISEVNGRPADRRRSVVVTQFSPMKTQSCTSTSHRLLQVLFVLGIAAAFGLALRVGGASPPTVLLLDNFNAATPNTTDLNVDITRQTGSLAPILYSMAVGPAHYGHQLQNSAAP